MKQLVTYSYLHLRNIRQWMSQGNSQGTFTGQPTHLIFLKVGWPLQFCFIRFVGGGGGILYSKNLKEVNVQVAAGTLFHVWDLVRTCCYLDVDSAKLLANALVSSCLDCCNALLSGIAGTDLTKLQRVQNQLIHIVTKSPPFTYSQCSTAAFPSLVTSKLELCSRSVCWPTKHCEKHRNHSVSVPRVKTNAGARALHSCTPSLWNNLPLSVRSATSVTTFRKRLKTHLFDLAFPP